MPVYAHARTVVLPASPKFYLVGDSLTSAHLQGLGGWRAFLYQWLVAGGYLPDFRGSIVNATDTPPLTPTSVAGISHSGLDGASGVNWYLSYWDSFNFPTSFPTPADYPQIVCLAVGTNDVDSAAASTSFCRLMDKAAEQVPTCHILMWTPPHNETAGSYETQAAQTRIEVANRRALGMNVHLVDANAVPLVTGDWEDGLHLSTRGYRKVAQQAWIPAVLPLLEGLR